MTVGIHEMEMLFASSWDYSLLVLSLFFDVCMKCYVQDYKSIVLGPVASVEAMSCCAKSGINISRWQKFSECTPIILPCFNGM